MMHRRKPKKVDLRPFIRSSYLWVLESLSISVSSHSAMGSVYLEYCICLYDWIVYILGWEGFVVLNGAGGFNLRVGL